MIDQRFQSKSGTYSLGALASLIGGEIVQDDSNFMVQDISAIGLAQQGDIVFFNHPKFRGELAQSAASVCVTQKRFATYIPANIKLILVDNPEQAFATIAEYFYPQEVRPRRSDGTAQISDNCDIAPTAILGPNVKIGAGTRIDDYAVIEEGAVIGANSWIGSHSVIGRNVQIGNDARIAANTTIQYAAIGDHFELDAGSRIGLNGYKFMSSPEGHVRFPQLGIIEIGDNVAIEGNVTIERGSLANTIIGSGTKIGNLVAIGHNVQIGRDCLIVAMSGIAGSAKLGNGVVLAAQVGVRDGVTLADGVKVAGQSGVIVDELIPNTMLEGTPAVRLTQAALKARLRAARDAAKGIEEGKQ